MLMSLAYSMNNDEHTADKFKAISSIFQLRQKGEISPLKKAKEELKPVSSVLAPATRAMNASLASLHHSDPVKSNEPHSKREASN